MAEIVLLLQMHSFDMFLGVGEVLRAVRTPGGLVLIVSRRLPKLDKRF